MWTLLMAAKSELSDLTAEHQREMEGLLESVRHLSREHKLHQLIIDSYIPADYQVFFHFHVLLKVIFSCISIMYKTIYKFYINY